MPGFLDRVGVLLKADAHGVLDSLEERSLLLKQSLREAELELARKRARCEALDEELRRLEQADTTLAAALQALDADAALALERDEDALVRFALRRLIERRKERALVRAQLCERQREREQHGRRLAEQEQAFEALRRRVRARLVVERERGPAAGFALRETEVSDEEVEIELLRRRDARASGSARTGPAPGARTPAGGEES